MFADKSFLDRTDSAQHEDAVNEIESSFYRSIDNGLAVSTLATLKTTILEHTDVSPTVFSSKSSAQFDPLELDLAPIAMPVRVRLSSYSQKKHEFFFRVLPKKRGGVNYPNLALQWALAPLLVPKIETAKSRYTMDLGTSSRFKIKHQNPSRDKEQRLTKLEGSEYFAAFDLSHR